ncbi:MAG: DEAD/DEAH box helicase family protein [Verrucomicrobiota bacterium]|nr:DEAD/DEAH box helicase family protein [Verrucomicrobiota bacterium]
MKFDPVTKTFEVSVRELAEDEGFHRIGFERGEGWNRLGLGAELHARILKERCAANTAYRCEVFLQTKIPVGEWTAIISGRLDGCIEQEKGQWLIEEFKSAYFSVDEKPSGAAFERHRRQLLIYCHLWQLLGHSPVSGALIYVNLASDTENRQEVFYDESQQQAAIQKRFEQSLAIWKAQEISRQKKASVAAELPFPHESPRPGQKKLIQAIQTAVRQKENLLAEAGTGSGKTAAGLFPALAEGLASGKQIVFLTAKTLQQKMAVNALCAMNRDGAFRTLQMRAKEKMCANTEVICHENFCPYAKNYPEKMERSKILERLRETQTHHDPDLVFAEAKREEVCPFEVQLELARSSDAIVADYNYVFEPGVALKHLSRDELENVILIVDEAHNLPDRARKIFSPELREEMAQKVIGKIFLQSDEVFKTISETLQTLVSLLQKCAEILPGGNAIAETAPPLEELRALWKEWEPRFIRYLSWKREAKIAQPDDAIVEIHFALHRFLAISNLYGPGFTCVVERTAENIRLALICLDPARPLSPIFRAASSTIFLSATLNPAEQMKRILGLEADRTMAISLPPPFPRENRKIMILPQVRTTFAAREKNYPRIARLISEMADAHSGNKLVLFPSYAFLTKVVEKMPDTRSQLLLQKTNASDFARHEILRALATPPPEGILLFAVLGGMYAEGVDYPGELLSSVFVVSPALPQVSFERELLRRYFDEQEQAGFAYAYLQPGMTRVIQAAGRLIRSETDRGAIALLCQRFLQEPYLTFLPRDWFDESPAELIAQNPAEEIRKFFEPGNLL